jgi:hypothetical protein
VATAGIIDKLMICGSSDMNLVDSAQTFSSFSTDLVE